MINNKNQYFAKCLILDGIFLAFIIYRLLILGSDTPFGISTGQELSTDPPQYTSFARNKIIFGNYEPYHSRYTFFVNNITTIIAYYFFKFIGTGRAQSNFIAMILSLFVVLFSFHLWKEKGFRLALLGAVFLGFNYIFINYGSLTFLEVTTIALLSLGSYFLLKNQTRRYSAFVAGMLFAVASFFGKLLAISFLIPSLLILFVEILQTKEERWKRVNVFYLFLLGYTGIFISWMVFVYLPARTEIGSYVSEISTGMYGFPKAFESIKMFMVQLYSYGFDIKLWSKQPLLLMAGFLGLASVIGMALSPKEQFIIQINRIDLYHALWLLGMFVFLFPWNYRPMRYAIIIFPAVAFLSARWLLLMIESVDNWGKRHWPYYAMIFLCASYISVQLFLMPKFEMRSIEIILNYIPYAMLAGASCMFLTILNHRYNLGYLLEFKKINFVLMMAIVLAFIVNQNLLYFANNFKNQTTILNASRDLGKILADDAVVIGSYSSALTQENDVGSIIKMFGIPTAEKDIFYQIPATHIAIEAGGGEGSNENRAFKDYPDIMRGAPIVASYYLRGYPVNVYLITQNSPNVEARRYRPSLYESAALYFRAGKLDSSQVLLDEFEHSSGKTISSIYLRMQIVSTRQITESSHQFLEDLIEIDEGNMNYWWMLGDSYLRANPPAFGQALAAYQRALSLKPNDRLLLRQLKIINSYINNV